jgi:uncharacterized damage-inducible protein DinB
MQIESFRKNWEWVHRMTVDFVNVVPDDRWEFSPGDGFGPFCKQLRHVVRVRGVYNEAMLTKRADFDRSREHYAGALTREALVVALDDKQREFLAALETVDIEAPIYFGTGAGAPAFTFENFTYEVVQHESIHHGQWSVYAAVGGFATPKSWQTGWKL